MGPGLRKRFRKDDRTRLSRPPGTPVGRIRGGCPHGTPIRTRDPEYRARYVTWLAEAETVAAFDPDARDRDAALRAATERLVFGSIDGRPRVAPESYRALVEAAFALDARRDELASVHGIYDLQPDGASRDLQRRIGLSVFVEGWLPYLDESDAKALLERTGLAREYDAVPQPATRPLPCSRCGGPLAIVTGARRVVCDHCGRLVEVIG